ncbi:MAG: sigma factor-like helix-turn-helix DNA-binding protein [Methylococcaceae bacterium]
MPDFSSSDQVIYLNQVLQKVESLPDNNKEALLLVVGEGLSHSEAATIIGCKESTVSWYIHEACKKLSDLLGGDNR